ncbi:MAG: UDP-N-acetylmuramate:L-alanyl-gamma-D-glutamyl-meso-diaminopimelate ligase [Acidobacteriota bacterium]|jgi:UDP-N-acetylmuramate: L-alanyl-gamma-D-glutamyl-meso-diaminopimelate ligase|nr:UDP-N-acetylmuramate:L-alanyl-gamma-D-glutamyl-meso-diaminopimelate ligase [Acidobacteriota bacterium]
MDIGKIHRIHLIGICGTAMASLGAMLKDTGFEVTGSDEGVYPPMSDFLAQKRIDVRKGYDAAHLTPAPDLVVVGNALSRGNPEIERMLDARIPFMSLPETLKAFFLRGKTPVVVTGTHGKTTTTSMISWGLASAGLQPNFLIGGIAENFQSSYGLGGGEHFVVEGDEYDSAFFDKGPKFLHYLPYLAVVGNVEFDHADIYADLDAVKLQFRRFVNLVPRGGFLAVGADSPDALEAAQNSFCRKETFGLSGDADWGARNIRAHAGGGDFTISYNGEMFLDVSLKMFGDYNIRNALASTAILHHLGVAAPDIRKGLESFDGVRRRMQLRAEVDGIRVYEDFAHHPTAVRETLAAVRAAFQPKKIWAIYEPRSATSRRNIFQREIAEALAGADCVAIPALFRPEKVPEAERLDEQKLIEDLQAQGRAAWNLVSADGIVAKVSAEARPGDVIVIMSNGGFGGIYEKLPTALQVGARRAVP